MKELAEVFLLPAFSEISLLLISLVGAYPQSFEHWISPMATRFCETLF